MQPPKIPDNEEQRLASLKTLNILDTPIQANFERITRITKNLFKVPIALFTLVDSDRQWFKSSQGLEARETPRDISFCGHTINQDKIFIVPDAEKDPRFSDNPLVTGHPNIRFYAGYPIHTPNGDKVGSLCIIDTKPRSFTQEDLSALKDMGELIEAEISANHAFNLQDQLSEELAEAKRQAMVDGLTQLWNRSGIEELVKKQIQFAETQHQNFSIALIDIDNFKSVNDTYGHNAGDCILREVAKRLIIGYRQNDSVGRWGGEEFLVILNNTSIVNSYDIAERARKTIASEPIFFENLEITITVTTGLKNFKWDEPCEVVSLVSEADKALYEGKIDGKNVVRISFDIKENK